MYAVLNNKLKIIVESLHEWCHKRKIVPLLDIGGKKRIGYIDCLTFPEFNNFSDILHGDLLCQIMLRCSYSKY